MTAKKPKRIPSFRRHKASGQGLVELNGQRIYLGRFDRPETQQRYHRLIAEWIANGRQLPVNPQDITIVELCARFWRHAQQHYRRPDGTLTSEPDNFGQALRPLKNLYGDTLAADFGPRALKAVRQRMIDLGWCRSNVNKQIGRLKMVFRWGVESELVPAGVYHALLAVAGLKRGRTEARESDPVKPVPEAHISAVRPHVSRQVWGLVQLQLFTGARAGELVKLRPIDFDTTGKVWTATIGEHKTAHHGRQRVIYFGPRSQEIVRAFIAGRAVDAYLFSPREAEHERHAEAPTHRRPGQPPTPRQTDRTMGEHYSVGSYRRVIQRGCVGADVPQWSPHRLRHSAATNIRREFGVEAAQLLLGHAKVDVTQLYAEIDAAKAVEIAAKVG